MRRMDVTLRILSTTLALGLSFFSMAQSRTTPDCKPPISRVRWHDLIDAEQRNALRADGKADGLFFAGNNEDVNYILTQTLTQRIDAIQCRIEKDTAMGDQQKIGYLRGLERIVRDFTNAYRRRTFNASQFPSLLDSYEAAINLDKKGESIERIFERTSYESGNMLIACQAFDRNPGVGPARNNLLWKYLHQHPEQTFTKLSENPNVPFRDSLIRLAGYKYPRRLYDYAAANNRLGYAIRAMDDSFIRTVSKMATSGSGQLYFPFLDNILAGKQTFQDIDAVKDDDVKYYKLLVKTRQDYMQRIREGEKIHELDALTKMMEKRARDVFIKTINALHEQPDAVRFKILYQLTAPELYYLVVSSESEIYTSSYVNGIYPIMMQKIGNRGDSLLMSVAFDRFKKFIKMGAGFNTLSQFLASFPQQEDAQVLMTAFVNGLEKSGGLEDGVDVADSYASIAETIKPVAAEMLKNVRLNYERNVTANNRRGMVIYDILYKLFQSADTSSRIDLTREFGIPPVYSVSHNSLTIDSSGRIVMQVFFFGDKDGKADLAGFLAQYNNANWKRTETKQWYQYNSVKGKPVSVFANKWFDETTGEDEKAQTALTQYLVDKGMSPTIVVHRGHSYYAESTIEHIQPTAKIVFLGSCGGYHLIHDVLAHSEDAHIIASKQIGRRSINAPFFNVLNERMITGKNIEWANFWKDFKEKAGREPGFEDYIPPHKNLGAIFIKAYNRTMGEEVALQ